MDKLKKIVCAKEFFFIFFIAAKFDISVDRYVQGLPAFEIISNFTTDSQESKYLEFLAQVYNSA